MSICVNLTRTDPSMLYPVLDPRRTAGEGPYNYGYALQWDDLVITVARTSALSNCQMAIEFVSALTEPKEIQAWNYFDDISMDAIGSASLGLGSSTIITRAGMPGQPCGQGVDTLVLYRHFAPPRGRTALYSFPAQDFWDFWGGCTVTFNWFDDTHGSGRWGNQTPPPIYPLVRFPDGTLMRNARGDGILVVFGGTGFAATPNDVTAMGLDAAAAIPFSQLQGTAADFTLVRELGDPKVYVVYGGAGFWIPDEEMLFSLGFTFDRVRVIPPGGRSRLRTLPIDGTILRGRHALGRHPGEQDDPHAYLVENGRLRLVTSTGAMDTHCIPWRHVRTVPAGSLATLPHGPDLS
jgi:hypothetical protein